MKVRTVILAAGDFPKAGGEARRLLAEADRVVACDSAADAYRRCFRKWPTVIVGDLDSIRSLPKRVETVRIAEQETNDLEKAIGLCERRGWKSPVIVGATGKFEDHAIGNIFRALEHGLEIVTDHGRFIPVEGKIRLQVWKGASISVFATDPKTRVVSKGLEWPLEGVRFGNLYCATSNRATGQTVSLQTTRRVYVYVRNAGKGTR